MNKLFVLATHVFLNPKGEDVYGPAHAVSLFLNKKGLQHLFIKHALYGSGSSTVEYYKDKRLVKTFKAHIVNLPLVRYSSEIIGTIRVVFEYRPVDLFVGIDPLNALSGIILKNMRIVRHVVYFSVDFADLRFENSFMNTLYHFLDKKAMFWSDQTWSVSDRILSYRKKLGLPDNKNLLLPNAPFFEDINRLSYDKIKVHDIVIVSAIENVRIFKKVLNVMSRLKKDIPDVGLIVIGSGSKEKELRDYAKRIGLVKDVNFLGHLSHEAMFENLAKCGVGLALYENLSTTNFHYYSDPMKVRDYLASGLPVIISGNSSIVNEVVSHKAGMSVKLDERDLHDKLLELLSSPKLHKHMRLNAINLAKSNNTYNLLNKYVTSL